VNHHQPDSMTRTTSCLIATLVLACISQSKAFVTIIVELDPYITSTPPACSASFVTNFESNLTAWVLNATHTISFLTDFSVPGGFHLSYQNTVTRRQLEEQEKDVGFRRLKTTTSSNSETCNRCTSVGCTLSCGLGTCNLCAGSRRRLLEEADTFSEETTNEKDLHVENRRQLTTADWSTVGTYVSNAIEPQIIYFASAYSGGCLGDYNLLGVNVTFVSDVPIDATMDAAMIAAFGAPAPAPPPNTAKACCSMDFMNCVTYCGTTQKQCQTCSSVDVGWLPLGPPAAGSCTARWNDCTSNVNGCCAGMQCIGDQWWKGCFYVPPLNAAAPPVTPPTAPSSSHTTPRPTLRPTPPPTKRPTAQPTVRWF
jgi:hypothetical protein